MKKIFVLALALVFVLSGAVMADGHNYSGVFPVNDFNGQSLFDEYYDGYEIVGDGDGVVVLTKVNSNNVILPNDGIKNRSGGWHPDSSSDGQKVEVTLNVEAYIPCFLEMRLTGNYGMTSVISYTQGKEAIANPTGYLIVFDNEIGGFLNESWESLGYGQYAEVNPGYGDDKVYIGACDYFGVEVVSNANYKYEVESDALSNTSDTTIKLPMEMQVSKDDGASWGWDVTFDSSKTKLIADEDAGNKTEAIHRFRVPYNMDTTTGAYDGTITFRAFTI